MREAQKVEGLRSALPSLPTVFQGKPPELDEPGLVGVYVQFASKPFLYGVQEALRVPLVLKTHHEIIAYRTMIVSPSTSWLRHFFWNHKSRT